MRVNPLCLALLILLLGACQSSSSKRESKTSSQSSQSKSTNESNAKATSSSNKTVQTAADFEHFSAIKIGHHINTQAHEYLPVYDPYTQSLIFSAMDRTGFFDFKIDYTQVASAGGEDIYKSEFKDGLWTDARPFTQLNTNGHEVITDLYAPNHYLICGNYPEKLGPKTANNGTETSDIFDVSVKGSSVQIKHLPEPVNSIFTEADAIMVDQGNAIVFVSDRPGHVGAYHKKGWLWNQSTWGNTDVYVSLQKEGYWQVPVSLGELVNSAGAERTPWLSEDGLTLYISSNGYEANGTDLNVYAFKRTNLDDWQNWQGPYKLSGLNTNLDDWGFKVYPQKGAFICHANPLGFKPTQGGKDGDGGIRETNFRTGYVVTGAQIAALKAEQNTDIYWHTFADQSFFTMPDVLFDVNAYSIKPAFHNVLDRLLDWCSMNEGKTLYIVGHCDNSGTAAFNQTLSENRAESIKSYLLSKNRRLNIQTEGKGAQQPLNQNKTAKDKQLNRRVECFFK